MKTAFVVLAVLAMLATLGVLFAGLVSMARGGEGAGRRSNKFMQYRVALQLAAVVFLVLAALLFSR